jgi:hypothetical protein
MAVPSCTGQDALRLLEEITPENADELHTAFTGLMEAAIERREEPEIKLHVKPFAGGQSVGQLFFYLLRNYTHTRSDFPALFVDSIVPDDAEGGGGWTIDCRVRMGNATYARNGTVASLYLLAITDTSSPSEAPLLPQIPAPLSEKRKRKLDVAEQQCTTAEAVCDKLLQELDTTM